MEDKDLQPKTTEELRTLLKSATALGDFPLMFKITRVLFERNPVPIKEIK